MTHVKQKTISTHVTTLPDKLIQVLEIRNDALPDLSKANVIPVDIATEYWQPVMPGESKRVVFDRIDTCKAPDYNNPDALVELECAFFFERAGEKIQSISNGSKRLVNAIQNLMNSPHSPFEIMRGSLLEITFKGKVKNKTNSFSSDCWGIRPITLKLKSK
jgi:hypothetical protein